MMFLLKKVFRVLLSGFLVVIIVQGLHGCATVGPDYNPPQTQVPAKWHAPQREGLTVKDAFPQNLTAWWTNLNDPALSALIERAAKGNLDLKKAVARVREARARRGLSRAELFPTLDASGSVIRSRGSRNSGGNTTRDAYEIGLDASWELDIFGGVRRSIEAAEADLQAGGEDFRDVLVSLFAEVALNYTELCTARTRLAVANESLHAQQETYRLTQWRYQAGLDDELAVQQSLYSLESTRSQIPSLQTAISEAKNRLAVLLGERPGVLSAELDIDRTIPAPPLEIAIGIPADVLRQRPDVRRAERQLAAQTARIGVAEAELYPKLKLSGAIGLDAFSIGGLFSFDAGSASGGFGITWRVFDAGAIRRNIEVQSAVQEQYLIAYESAVLAALEEAENALFAYAEEQKRRRSLLEASRAAEQARDLARMKYEAGLTDFGDVLDAERSLLNFRDQLAQSDGSVATDLIKIYKAMGGGWTLLAPDEEKLSANGDKS